MPRRLISLLICLAVCLTIIAGCSNTGNNTDVTESKESEKKATDKATDEPVKITFWVPGSGKLSDDYFINAAKEFEEANAGIIVETTILPPATPDINTKLNAAQLSGTYPDVFSSFIIFIGTRGTRGEFLDLKPYIDQWEDKDDIYSSSFDLGVYKGKVYGVSYFPAPEILVYRKDFFKEAGLDPEKPPKNWEELEDYAVRLTKRDSNNNIIRAGLDIPVINPQVFIKPFIWQNGAFVIDEEKEVPTINDMKVVEAFEFLKGLIDKNVSIPYDYQKKEDVPFIKGNSAMSFIASSNISNMLNNDPSLKDKIGYAMPLEKEKKVPFTGHRLFTIGADTKYSDESWEFIKFMMSREQMLKRSEALNMPVVRKSLEQDYLKTDAEFKKVILEYAKYGKSAEVASFTAIANKYLDDAYQAVYTGKKEPKKALDDAQAGMLKDIQK